MELSTCVPSWLKLMMSGRTKVYLKIMQRLVVLKQLLTKHVLIIMSAMHKNLLNKGLSFHQKKKKKEKKL